MDAKEFEKLLVKVIKIGLHNKDLYAKHSSVFPPTSYPEAWTTRGKSKKTTPNVNLKYKGAKGERYQNCQDKLSHRGGTIQVGNERSGLITSGEPKRYGIFVLYPGNVVLSGIYPGVVFDIKNDKLYLQYVTGKDSYKSGKKTVTKSWDLDEKILKKGEEFPTYKEYENVTSSYKKWNYNEMLGFLDDMIDDLEIRLGIDISERADGKKGSGTGYVLAAGGAGLGGEKKDGDPKKGGMDDKNPSHSLNLILYGPPGTGKTYNTLFHALKIIKGEDVIKGKSYDDLKPEFDRLVSEGQIVFTTFHQSMSYEDFIEGIKPIPPQNKEEQMVYDVQDGIFKEICEKAKKISVVNTSTKIDFSKTRVFKMSLGEKGKDADSVFEYCVENEVLALGWGDSINFSDCKTREEFKRLDSSWGAAALEIFKEWMKTGDIVLISDGTKEVKGIAQVAGDYEFRDDPSIDMHQFRKAKWLYTGNNIPISKIYDKNLSQQSIYGFYKEKKGVVDNGGIKIDVLNEIITGEINDKKEENYVLIIDEINRGNVAQIFGELITLIEPSKRLDNSEEMKAILPYSSAQKGKPEYFGVPNNLYIIGTMNTADRSVEALDTALRRRFSFEEMMPKPELLRDKELCGVKLSDLLTTINQRIVALKDREHQIGHSYFMGLKTESDLKDVFKDKIIPLLQEYFYGDYKKIYYVLGPGFVEKKTEKTIFAIENPDYDEFDIPEERYDIASFDAEFVIKDAIDKMKVQKLDSGATTIETDATAESEESTDKK